MWLPTEQPVHRAIERLQQHRALLGRKATLEDQRAVFVGVTSEAAMTICRECGVGFFEALRLTHLAHDSHDVRRGVCFRDGDELSFVVPVRHARDRPNLGIAEFAVAELIADQRQLRQRMRDAHFLARGHQIETAVRVQPMRTTRHLLVAPRLQRVQPFDQLEQPILGAVNVCAQ